jgi:tetratricopeptide (TPR) repeat protein
MYKIKKDRGRGVTDPTQIVESVGQAAGIAREHLPWVIGGIAVALVAGLVVGGVFWMRQQEDRAAADLLNEGTRVFSERSGGPLPRRPEELKKAVEVLRKVVAEYPRSTAAAQAAYLLGNALSDLKEWDGAVKAYQDFLARYGDQRLLVPLVYQRLAYVQLSQGKKDEAEKTLSAILSLEGAPNKDQALFELARIEELSSRPEGALARYQELMKEHPKSPFSNEAAVRVKTLDARKAAQTPPPTSMPSAPETTASPSPK